ncbi:glycosyltransferase family 4 protein [Winogradskyella sp.]|uniref:glycosyltransferase family 4 protein n=1 Tax=Winogradskyella sp. TaxID=1883156 RepID=UPI00262273AB|nr:glycosyltransferase family 4 protein [Winogradskyella sp.]
MHICFITSEYPKAGHPHGGIGTFVSTISHELVKRCHEVSVVGINVYTETKETETDGNVLIYRLKPRKVKGLTWWFNSKAIHRKLIEIHQKKPIDIIETAELGLAFIKKIKPIGYIIRLHGGHHFFAEAENRKVTWWKGFQERRSFKKADGFIAVSNYVKTHTAKYLSYHGKPIEIIMSPINLDIFEPKPYITTQSQTLLFAGTVCEKKGAYQLVKAMPRVIRQFPEVQLYIYGRDWFFKDGRSYISFLKDYISELNIDPKHIQFMGAVNMNDLAERYAAAEVCVFPSLMETQGLVAPEAMAMEKLVIFTECGPGKETITHKDTGLLCNPYDENDIADKILWALSNQEDCKTIAQKGRAYVLSNFNMDTVLNKNLGFYESVISNK